ncbi:MAG: hypothetical protein KF799_00970 [Bdellovibrionales bacterium]|nr:hypothetical protein [Bdellovibrionales bacterium]
MNMWSFTIAFAFLLSAGSTFATPKKKESYAIAKKECLKEDPQLKAKALQKCIAKKRK